MNVQCMRLYEHLTKLCAHDDNKGVEGVNTNGILASNNYY